MSEPNELLVAIKAALATVKDLNAQSGAAEKQLQVLLDEWAATQIEIGREFDSVRYPKGRWRVLKVFGRHAEWGYRLEAVALCGLVKKDGQVGERRAKFNRVGSSWNWSF